MEKIIEKLFNQLGSFFHSFSFDPKEKCKTNLHLSASIPHILSISKGGARGVMVIVVGNGHGDTSSNPGRN